MEETEAKAWDEAVAKEMAKGHQVFRAKNRQYGGAFFHEPFRSALQNIIRKERRIEGFTAESIEMEGQDSIEDTLIDLGNYCFMTAIFVSRGLHKIKAPKEKDCPNCKEALGQAGMIFRYCPYCSFKLR